MRFRFRRGKTSCSICPRLAMPPSTMRSISRLAATGLAANQPSNDLMVPLPSPAPASPRPAYPERRPPPDPRDASLSLQEDGGLRCAAPPPPADAAAPRRPPPRSISVRGLTTPWERTLSRTVSGVTRTTSTTGGSALSFWGVICGRFAMRAQAAAMPTSKAAAERTGCLPRFMAPPQSPRAPAPPGYRRGLGPGR
jgi:hypothetical protein